MPVVNVNLTDTFDQWRVKTNTISNSFGDLVLLSTDVKTDLVSAVNEIKLVADTAEANASSKLENVVEDITPELGGDLSLNSRNLIGTGNINITGNIDVTGVITGTIIVGGDLSGTTNNAQINPNAVGINELNVVDGIAGQALFTDGNGNLSFNNVVTDPTLGGDLSGTTSNAQINVNAVDGTHIAIGGDTAGDILYYNGTDYTRLPKGQDGEVLKTISGNPQWDHYGLEFIEDTFVADGIADTFSPLSQVAVSEESLLVFIDGVAQPSTAFTLPTETSITFSSPPAQNSNIRVLHLGTPVPIADLSADPTMGGDLSGLSSNAQIVANAVGTTELADGSVTNAKLAANSITSDKILLDVIVAEDLAANSVTFSELQDGAVRTAKIQDNAVTGAKIAMGSDAAGDVLYYNGTDYARLAAGTAGQVLTMNSGATAPEWAADSTDVGGTAVGGDVSGTVSNIQINANAIGSSELANNSVTGSHIALGSDAAGDVMYYNGTDYVRLAKGTAGQVLKMNSGATAPEWAADIDTTIGDAAVGGDVTGTISNITIPNNTITSAMIAPGVIVAQDIATNAVNGTHIAMGSDAAGDILYYNGTDYTRLAKGTAGQVLTMNSGATAPEWAADSTNVSNTAVGGMMSGTVGNISINAGVVTPTMLSATGTADSTTFLRGDGVWAEPTMTESDPHAVTMAIALGG